MINKTSFTCDLNNPDQPSCSPAAAQTQVAVVRYHAAGREEGLGWRKPTPEPDGKGNVRFPVVQLLSNVRALVENMIRNGNLLVFCIPCPDIPRAPTQKMWGGPELCILASIPVRVRRES